jgi:hypothetical protein
MTKDQVPSGRPGSDRPDQPQAPDREAPDREALEREALEHDANVNQVRHEPIPASHHSEHSRGPAQGGEGADDSTAG